MGVPMPDMEPVENASAEALLDSLKTIDPGERRKHASVFNYWQSIRGNRPFPPIRDLDPLEISDAGPWSILLEMIGGGEDAVVRHFGQEISGGIAVEKIGEAPNPSLLASIHAKLPIVAACREAFAFEETFDTGDGARRCWVTLLPFSQTGSWIDFVYGYVSLEGAKDAAEAPAEDIAEAVADEPAAADEDSEIVEDLPEPEAVAEDPAEEDSQELFPVGLKPSDEEQEAAEAATPIVPMVPEPEPEAEPAAQLEPELPAEAEPIEEATEADASDEVAADREPQPQPDEEPELDAQSKPRFSAKFLEGLASSFYGKVSQSTPTVSGGHFEAEPVESLADEPAETMPDKPAEPVTQPASNGEGVLQSKLSEVRTLAAEAREAQVRSNIALYEGLSAAYDFALDAESEPEEYLRLVEAQGLKIQLRSPMKPVVKLAFDGMCDEPTIKQLEAVLAWALKQDLPRGTLADRIQEEGGIGQILNGKAAA
jgi:hypothetical protein